MQVCSTCNMLFICSATPLLLLLFCFALSLFSLSSLHSFSFAPRHCTNLYFVVQRAVAVSCFLLLLLLLYLILLSVMFCLYTIISCKVAVFLAAPSSSFVTFTCSWLEQFCITHTPRSLPSVCILFARATLPRCAVSCRMASNSLSNHVNRQVARSQVGSSCGVICGK